MRRNQDQVTLRVGSALSPDDGSKSLSSDNVVQVWSDTDLTKQGNAHLTILFMPMMLRGDNPHCAGLQRA